MNREKFTLKAQEALQEAKSIAERKPHQQIDMGHLFSTQHRKSLTRGFLLDILARRAIGIKGDLLKKLKKGGLMKKRHLYILMICFLVFSLAGLAHGWQGRMEGMGNPYGLVEDESDFLIHPFGIANGEGLKFYGGYSFKYRDVLDWDYTLNTFTPGTGTLREQWPFRGSGDEIKHDALLGTTFPLGSGRMGLFFNYVGKRGDFSGHENEFDNGSNFFHEYDLKSDLDAFSFRLLYGLPLGNIKIGGLPMGIFKFGGEIALAYRNEENKSFFNRDFGGGTRIFKENSPFGEWQESRNTLPFEFPYDSRYWEVFLKASLGGSFGPAMFAFTPKVGFTFAADNRLEHERSIYPAGIFSFIEMDGGVKGCSIESDFWLRYALSKDLSLPFLGRIGYQKKTWDGSGQGFGFLYQDQIFDYKVKESSFYAEIGGGLDKEFMKGTRIASGIYYDYLHEKNGYSILRTPPGVPNFNLDQFDYPSHKEHRFTLRVTGEKELSPLFTMRMGINLFYGWVKESFSMSYRGSVIPVPRRIDDSISLNGSHWGIGLSLGGTVRFQRYSIEPFFNVGYQKQDLDGDGERIASPAPGVFNRSLEMDKLMKDWSIGGGFSIKF